MDVFCFFLLIGSGICLSLPIESTTEKPVSLTLLQKNIDKLIQASQQVAFTACMSTGDHLGDHQTIEYDHVVTNLGGGYDTRHSHFTAPISGLYQFAATVMSKISTVIHLRIVKNGSELVKVFSMGYSDETGTNVVNTHLEKGDMVWVQNMDTGSQLEGGLWNCFSGTLIQADL